MLLAFLRTGLSELECLNFFFDMFLYLFISFAFFLTPKKPCRGHNVSKMLIPIAIWIWEFYLAPRRK